MKEYLKEIAIKIKVENFKEFGKTKEETANALIEKFEMSREEAQHKIQLLWE